MAVTLASIIFALLIELAGFIFALLIEVLVDVILALLLKKPCVGGRASRCHPQLINGSARRSHLCTTFENH